MKLLYSPIMSSKMLSNQSPTKMTTLQEKEIDSNERLDSQDNRFLSLKCDENLLHQKEEQQMLASPFVRKLYSSSQHIEAGGYVSRPNSRYGRIAENRIEFLTPKNVPANLDQKEGSQAPQPLSQSTLPQTA